MRLSLIALALCSLPTLAQVTLTDNDGKARKGRDILVSAAGEITVLTDGESFTTKLDDISEISWGEARPVAAGGEWEIQLATPNPRCRDLIPGVIADPSDNDHVRIMGTDAGDVEFPIGFAYAVTSLKSGLSVPEQPPGEDTLTVLNKEGKRDSDKGELLRIAKEEIILHSTTFGNDRTYKMSSIEGIHLAPTLKPEPPPGVLVVVTTKKNMRITGRIVEMTAKICRMETTHKQKGKSWEVAIQADKVASIQVMNGNLAYLSDMNPVLLDGWRRHTQNPDEKLPKEGWFFLDRKVMRNETITLRSKPYRKGISTKMHVELSFDLGAAFSRFTASVGLSDEAAPTGNVDAKLVFVVKGDGKELWRSESLSFDSPAKPVSLDVKGVKTLVLETETSDPLDSLEFGVWGDARVVK